MDTGTILWMDTGTFVGTILGIIVGAIIGWLIALWFARAGKEDARKTDRKLDEVLALLRERNPDATKELVLELAGAASLGGAGSGVIEIKRGEPEEKELEEVEVVVSEEVTEAVDEAITQLPEDEKTFVTLSYYERLSEEEIGQVLQLPAAEVQELQNVTFRHLIENLGPDFGSDTM